MGERERPKGVPLAAPAPAEPAAAPSGASSGASLDPTRVYAWAIWRDASGLYHRARMHLPLEVVHRYAVGPLPAPDLMSRVVPQIERDLVSETVQRGARWNP